MFIFKKRSSPSRTSKYVKTVYIKKTGNFSAIERSKLLDLHFYNWKHKLAFTETRDAIAHYLVTGWKKYYDPHPLFNTHHYILQAGALRQPALLHYLNVGFRKKSVLIRFLMQIITIVSGRTYGTTMSSPSSII